jgi:two-component system response regulator GlrR
MEKGVRLSLCSRGASLNTPAMPTPPGKVPRPAASRRAAPAPPRIDLVLYVSGHSRHTPVAQRNCQNVLSRFDPRAIQFEVCDVSAHPDRAEEDAVLFTPMLVKRHPLPRTYVVGDMSNAEPVIDLLAACGVRPAR